MLSYYDILADPDKRTRWFLDEPLAEGGETIDAREFTQGVSYRGLLPARVPVYHPGEVVNFNLAAFDMPVVSREIAGIFTQFANSEVQCFPVGIEGHERDFDILNVTSRVRCLDERSSKVTKWTPLDGRPEKIGAYRMVTDIKIDPELCAGRHVFRIMGWEVALIVSAAVKDAIECIPNTGVVFNLVV